MEIDFFNANIGKKENVLALGPESSGNFSLLRNGKIFFCRSGLDLLDEENFEIFKKSVLAFLKKEKMKPDVILTDLHPGYRTTVWGEILAKRFKAKNIKIQHHSAHIFSAIGDSMIHNTLCAIPDTFYGIACDGTGYGPDGKIWGGEAFQVKSEKCKVKSMRRIGHLENQVLIGGDLAVREPARMLISILGRFLDKKEIYKFVKTYYSSNQFELLYNQLQNGFNCQETSSTARVLDAASVLLGFSENRRDEKHGPVLELEKKSTLPYKLKPEIAYNSAERNYILLTTPLFEYLIKNLNKDKKRLAATAQFYLAQGLHEIIKKYPASSADNKISDIPLRGTTRRVAVFSGGMADNKIMSKYLSLQGFHLSKKIPRGDAGISFGQIICYLSGASRS